MAGVVLVAMLLSAGNIQLPQTSLFSSLAQVTPSNLVDKPQTKYLELRANQPVVADAAVEAPRVIAVCPEQGCAKREQ